MSVPSPSSPRRALLCAIALLALLGAQRGLWTPDEPREAEISREMLLSPGVIPTLNGEAFIEKPPLYYWVVAGVFHWSGGPSVAAARAVSIAAGVATLLCLLCWAGGSGVPGAGIIATAMLATCLQFVVATHWVLIDPLLMLTTTLAAWAAWRLLSDDAGAAGHAGSMRALLYAALVAALWIKGLIGPVLIAAGLAAYVGLQRPAHWRRLWPLRGALLLAVALLVLGLLIYARGGREALWQWAWVNQVRRLLDPLASSGHRQPLLYYGWTLPYALLPWLPALIGAIWPGAPRPRVPLARYGALLSAAMLLVLTLSASKRENYLMPVLPLLMLWLGVRVAAWWQRWQHGSGPLGALWWCQVGVLCVYTLLAPVAAWLWRGSVSPAIAAALLAALAALGMLLAASLRGQRARAGVWVLAAAFTANAMLLALSALLLDGIKNMGPFMSAVGERLPIGEPVYAANLDETLTAAIGFYTGRRAVPIDLGALGSGARAAALPRWLLLQDNRDQRRTGDTPMPSLPSDYQLVCQRAFGAGRRLQLWQLAPR